VMQGVDRPGGDRLKTVGASAGHRGDLLRPLSIGSRVVELGDKARMVEHLEDGPLPSPPQPRAEANGASVRGEPSRVHSSAGTRREARTSVLSSSVRSLMGGESRYVASAALRPSRCPVSLEARSGASIRLKKGE